MLNLYQWDVIKLCGYSVLIIRTSVFLMSLLLDINCWSSLGLRLDIDAPRHLESKRVHSKSHDSMGRVFLTLCISSLCAHHSNLRLIQFSSVYFLHCIHWTLSNYYLTTIKHIAASFFRVRCIPLIHDSSTGKEKLLCKDDACTELLFNR